MNEALMNDIARAARNGGIDVQVVLVPRPEGPSVCVNCDEPCEQRLDVVVTVGKARHCVEHKLCAACAAAERDEADRAIDGVFTEVAWSEQSATDAQLHRDSWKGAL